MRLALADAVAILHAAYIAFVVIGFAAIVAGAIACAGWARNPVPRILHVAAILLVCVEVAIGGTLERDFAGDFRSAIEIRSSLGRPVRRRGGLNFRILFRLFREQRDSKTLLWAQSANDPRQ